MKKGKILFFSLVMEILIIGAVGISTLFTGPVYDFFYNGVYGLALSVAVPLYLLIKNKEDFSSVGFKRIGLRQIIVLIIFDLFSIGGQLIPRMAQGEKIAWQLLPICVMPLIMSTIFEEFLFRGFVQTRVEKSYGPIIAIIVSACMFAFYHLGYPGFRSISDIGLMLAVGAGFALAYKLSDNNLIIAYFVNLPNAFMTYILHSEWFPSFDHISGYALITNLIVVAFFLFAKWKKSTSSSQDTKVES